MCSAVVSSDDVLIYAVGDIGPSRPDPDTLFDYVRPTLQRADVAFMQLELPISERGARLRQERMESRPICARIDGISPTMIFRACWSGLPA